MRTIALVMLVAVLAALASPILNPGPPPVVQVTVPPSEVTYKNIADLEAKVSENRVAMEAVINYLRSTRNTPGPQTRVYP